MIQRQFKFSSFSLSSNFRFSKLKKINRKQFTTRNKKPAQPTLPELIVYDEDTEKFNLLYEMNQHKEMVDFAFETVKLGRFIDQDVFPKILDILRETGEINRAETLFRDRRRAEQWSIESWVSFITGLIENENETIALEYCHKFMDTGRDTGVEILSCMIVAYMKLERMDEALEVYYEIVKETEDHVDLSTYNIMIDVFTKNGRKEIGLFLLNEVKKFSQPSSASYLPLITAYLDNGEFKSGYELYLEMEQYGLSPDVTTYNILIRKFLDDDPEISYRMFNQMRESNEDTDLETYNHLLESLCKTNKEDAVLFYQNMLKTSTVKPDHITHLQVIETLRRLNREEEAIALFQKIKDSEGQDTVEIRNVILKTYVNGDEILEAQKFFADMKEVGLVNQESFSLIIQAYSGTDKAEGLFEEMKEEGYKPDPPTYTSVISRMFESGREEEARALFMEMKATGMKTPYKLWKLFSK